MLGSTAILTVGATQPTILSLEDAKAHLNITHTHQDDLIQSYVDAAIAEAESYTSRSLKYYSVTLTTNRFIDGLLLTLTPFKANLVVKYYDADNAEQTLDTSNYVLVNHFGAPTIVFNDMSVLPTVYNRQDAVVITYDSGYTPELMPVQFVQFCKLMVGTFYEHRTDSVDRLPRLSYNLIHKFKSQWQ